MTRLAVSLVLGGTGMLAEATQWLAARSEQTLLVARGARRFAGHSDNIMGIDADWTGPGYAEAIRAAIRSSGPVEAALLWLHEPGPILPWLLPELPAARVVLVLGSLDGRPEIPAGTMGVATVRLGSVRTPQGRRWLTHDEISGAAIAALEDGESRVVGELAGTD